MGAAGYALQFLALLFVTVIGFVVALALVLFVRFSAHWVGSQPPHYIGC